MVYLCSRSPVFSKKFYFCVFKNNIWFEMTQGWVNHYRITVSFLTSEPFPEYTDQWLQNISSRRHSASRTQSTMSGWRRTGIEEKRTEGALPDEWCIILIWQPADCPPGEQAHQSEGTACSKPWMFLHCHLLVDVTIDFRMAIMDVIWELFNNPAVMPQIIYIQTYVCLFWFPPQHQNTFIHEYGNGV